MRPCGAPVTSTCIAQAYQAHCAQGQTAQRVEQEHRRSRAIAPSGDSQGNAQSITLRITGMRGEPGAPSTRCVRARLLRQIEPLIASQPHQSQSDRYYKHIGRNVPTVRHRNVCAYQQKTRRKPGFCRLGGGGRADWAHPPPPDGWKGVPPSQNWLKTGTSGGGHCHVTGLWRGDCHVTYKVWGSA